MRDLFMESRLTREGVEWDFMPDVPLAKINLLASRANQARVQRLIPSVVERYTMAMIDGVEFPPMVAYFESRYGYVLMDGNQRHEAAIKAEVASFDLYVVRTNDKLVRERLTRSLNLDNGAPPTEREIIEHAMHMVKTFSMTATDVAKIFQIKENTLQVALRTEVAKARLVRQKVDLRNIPSSLQYRLGAINDDGVMKAVAEIASMSTPTTNQIMSLITEVRGAHSIDGALKVIDDFRNLPGIRQGIARRSGGRLPTPTPHRVRYLRVLSDAESMLDKYPDADRMQLLPADIEEARRRWTVIRAKMVKVLGPEEGFSVPVSQHRPSFDPGALPAPRQVPPPTVTRLA